MSVFFFPEDNMSKYQWILPNLVCALVLWIAGLELLMGIFRQFLTEFSAWDTSILSFQDNNLSKSQWTVGSGLAKLCIL